MNKKVEIDSYFSIGLYYNSIQNDIGAERAFLEANRLNVATPQSAERPSSAEQPAELDGQVPYSGGTCEPSVGDAQTDVVPHVLGNLSMSSQ